jgi:hypothetical protein
MQSDFAPLHSRWRNLRQSEPFPNFNRPIGFVLLCESADLHCAFSFAGMRFSRRPGAGQNEEFQSSISLFFPIGVVSGCGHREQSLFVFIALNIGFQGLLMDQSLRDWK